LKTVSFLRSLGFDTKTLGDLNLKGKSDLEIVNAAKEGDRAILTFDKDFGEIYYFSERGNLTAIILALDNQTSENVNSVMQKFLNMIEFDTIRNKLIILSRDRIRLISK